MAKIIATAMPPASRSFERWSVVAWQLRTQSQWLAQ